ncbi:MAG: RluA family pseudouridine synthase, partial [Actinomycetota bacterium]
DKYTSGLLVVAKSDRAYDALGSDMAARRIQRLYLALVAGVFRLPTGRIEAPIGRLPQARTMMGVTAGGREAITDFRVREGLGRACLIEAALLTGRTHQIRVHFAHIGHPIVGDPVYGKRTRPLAGELGLGRPFLHAARLRFVHPISGEEVNVEEPLPPELEKALAKARCLTGAH